MLNSVECTVVLRNHKVSSTFFLTLFRPELFEGVSSFYYIVQEFLIEGFPLLPVYIYFLSSVSFTATFPYLGLANLVLKKRLKLTKKRKQAKIFFMMKVHIPIIQSSTWGHEIILAQQICDDFSCYSFSFNYETHRC